jgi:hypothetical protein
MDPLQRRDYEKLVAALETRFGPGRQTQLYRAQLKNRIRKRNEPVIELAQEIKRLVRLAYPSASMALRDQLTRDSFLDSLNDSELEWAVFNGKPTSIDDAVQLSVEYEAFQDSHKRRYGKSEVRMQHETSPFNDIEGRVAKLEIKEEGNSTNTEKNEKRPYMNKPNNGACHYCSQPGHWKRDCRKRQFDQQNRNTQYPPTSFQQRRNNVSNTPSYRSGNDY